MRTTTMGKQYMTISHAGILLGCFRSSKRTHFQNSYPVKFTNTMQFSPSLLLIANIFQGIKVICLFEAFHVSKYQKICHLFCYYIAPAPNGAGRHIVLVMFVPSRPGTSVPSHLIISSTDRDQIWDMASIGEVDYINISINI